MESRRRELQAKRLQREKEQQVNIRQRQMEELERRAQYATEMEQKRERSEAILRDRETTIQKVRTQVTKFNIFCRLRVVHGYLLIFFGMSYESCC